MAACADCAGTSRKQWETPGAGALQPARESTTSHNLRDELSGSIFNLKQELRDFRKQHRQDVDMLLAEQQRLASQVEAQRGELQRQRLELEEVGKRERMVVPSQPEPKQETKPTAEGRFGERHERLLADLKLQVDQLRAAHEAHQEGMVSEQTIQLRREMQALKEGNREGMSELQQRVGDLEAQVEKAAHVPPPVAGVPSYAPVEESQDGSWSASPRPRPPDTAVVMEEVPPEDVVEEAEPEPRGRKHVAMEEDPAVEEPPDVAVKASATSAAMAAVGWVTRLIDRFHNVEPVRPPSRIGVCMTLLLVPGMIAYLIYWIINFNDEPPLEEVDIKWSTVFGPFPIILQCLSPPCWVWVAGCELVYSAGSGDIGTCWQLGQDEELTVEMCYSADPRGGLHGGWPNQSDPGIQFKSWVWTGGDQIRFANMRQRMEPGLSLAKLVLTHNLTVEEGEPRRSAVEWYNTFLSSAKPPALPGPCEAVAAAAGASQASISQIAMAPDFIERTIEKPDPWAAFVGDMGGAYGLLSVVLLYVYLCLWNAVHYKRRKG